MNVMMASAIESKPCECGCGEPAPIAKRTDRRKGWISGKPMRFVRNHNMRRKRGPEPKRWQPVEPRFFSKVEMIPFHECWEWSGKRNTQGYGMIWVNGKEARAHRVSFEIHKGKIPDGMVICHRCDNPGCVNPEHLLVGSQAENVADCIRKGRNSLPTPRYRSVTHCKRGHEFTPDNTMKTVSGKSCRRCNRDRSAAWHEKRRASKC